MTSLCIVTTTSWIAAYGLLNWLWGSTRIHTKGIIVIHASRSIRSWYSVMIGMLASCRSSTTVNINKSYLDFVVCRLLSCQIQKHQRTVTGSQHSSTYFELCALTLHTIDSVPGLSMKYWAHMYTSTHIVQNDVVKLYSVESMMAKSHSNCRWPLHTITVCTVNINKSHRALEHPHLMPTKLNCENFGLANYESTALFHSY